MLKFENIAVGGSQRPRCAHCGGVADETLRDTPSILEDIRNAAATWSRGPGPNLSFMGAEPFDHPDLFALLDEAVGVGIARIRLESNAHALVARETAECALRSGVRHLRFSVIGSTAKPHDLSVGETESLKNSTTGVKRFVEAALENGTTVHVTAEVPVCRHNLHETANMIALASKIGATEVLLRIDDPDLDLRQAALWLEAACDTGVVRGMWVAVEGLPEALAGGWELHLVSASADPAGVDPYA